MFYEHETPSLPFSEAESPDALAKTVHYGTRYFLDVLVFDTANVNNPNVGIARKGSFIFWDKHNAKIFTINPGGYYVLDSGTFMPLFPA
jgi:hypothetical protein